MKSLIEALDDLHDAAANFLRAVAEAVIDEARQLRAGKPLAIIKAAVVLLGFGLLVVFGPK